jgi:hypothetical protein
LLGSFGRVIKGIIKSHEAALDDLWQTIDQDWNPGLDPPAGVESAQGLG